MSHSKFVTLLTHAGCTDCDAENLEQPAFQYILRCIVLCKLMLDARGDVQAALCIGGGVIRWWGRFAMVSRSERVTCTGRRPPSMRLHIAVG
jgi:hypothetical protein